MKTQTTSSKKYRIGIDVGDFSVGFSAIEYDDKDIPTKVLASVSHIHDGGRDPSSGQSPSSRTAVSGLARRSRRMLRNKKRRLKYLDNVLEDLGFDVPVGDIPQTNDAWIARARLVEEFIDDESERKRLIVMAVRHIARHRGWRSPWWSFEQLSNALTPTENLTKVIDNVVEKFGIPTSERPITQGQVGSLAVRPGVIFRPRRTVEVGQKVTAGEEILFAQTRQEDILYELKLIFQTQKIAPEDAKKIEIAVFKQEKPRIRSELVGFDELPGMGEFHRAPIACLEFQEHRIRATVANLRFRSIKTKNEGGERLTFDQQDQVLEALLANRDIDRPSWRDIEALLGFEARSLVNESQDSISFPPLDDTSRKIEAKFNKKSDLGAWWRNASRDDRAKLVWYLVENTLDTEELEKDEILELLANLDEESLVKLQSIEFQSGRASYSKESLIRLNQRMKDEHLDLHDARKAEFGVPDDWKPPRESLDDRIDHPTVQRVNSIVRKLILASYGEWGVPEKVVIEHVRSALLGPAARLDYEKEIASRQRTKQEIRNQLIAQGITDPKDADIRRNECIMRQNCVCLYCGTTITLTTSELDHIVPQSMGGSNRQENLVAVCRPCNSEKRNQPFPQFAQNSKRSGISLEESLERIQQWTRGQLTSKRFNSLKRDVASRLKQTTPEPPEGDRSLESTAYSARLIRDRVETTLTRLAGKDGVPPPKVFVFRGEITSEARKAGGVDKLLRLRGSDVKTRFDRRHHAVDAAVITTLSNSIADTLAHRKSLQNTDRIVGNSGEWKKFTGYDFAAKQLFEKWKASINALANLLCDAADKDHIRVVRQLRLTPSVGRVHMETVVPLEYRNATLPLSQSDLLRVADPKLFVALSEASDPTEGLAVSEYSRIIGGREISKIPLFPSNAAYIRVRDGAAAIGDTSHHARLYAWKSGAGYSIGMIRVFAGEFAQIGFLKEGVDVLKQELPSHSISLRSANPALVKRISNGEAKFIGVLALNDEIEIDPGNLATELGDTKLNIFLKYMPETNWIVTGLFDQGRISIAPSLLAYEGVDENTPEIVASVLKSNRIPMAVNVVLGNSGSRIIRRTVLGRPRWNSDSMLCSWVPMEAAEAAFR